MDSLVERVQKTQQTTPTESGASSSASKEASTPARSRRTRDGGNSFSKKIPSPIVVANQLRTRTRRAKTGARPGGLWNKMKLKQRVQLHAPGLFPLKIDVCLDVSGQHKLSWDQPLSISPDSPLRQLGVDESVILPRGWCNLYTYPSVNVRGQVTGVPTGKLTVSGGQLHLLNQLILSIVRDTHARRLMDVPDEVGAYPAHALLVANTRESLDISWKIFQA